jgi:hypothetical protein
MRPSAAQNIKLLATLIAISVFFLFCSANTLLAGPMPAEKLQPITTNLTAPVAVALDANERIYVTEPSYNRLNVYSQSGAYLKRLSGLDKPLGIAVDSSGRVFVGNGDTGNVEVYEADFTLLFKLGSGDGEFTKPCAIAIDSMDNIYVADCEEDTIKVYNSDGSFSFSFGSYGSGNGQFSFPSSIAIDESDELEREIIISDHPVSRVGGWSGGNRQTARLQVFHMNGDFKRSFGAFGAEEGNLIKPMGVAVDGDSRIYVSDAYLNVVQVFDAYGGSLGYIADPADPLRSPLGIAFGDSNRLFIASRNTEKIEIYGIDLYTNMEVTPLSLSFEGIQYGDNPALHNVEIKNNGNKILNWTASTNESWITLSETFGSTGIGGISSLNVGVDLTGLLPGTYTGAVEIRAESGATEVVNISLTVISTPSVLSVTPSSLEFTSVNGSIPSSQNLSIENTGGGILNWSASSDRTWFLLDKNSGTAPDTVNVSVDVSSLGEGTHAGNIAVTGEQGVLGSPVIVPVTLNIVMDKGTIEVSTNLEAATFTIIGPAFYADSGTSWSVTDTLIGTYTIIYGDVNGYITPASETQTLQKDGVITFTGQYEPKTGTIEVSTNLEAATFTIIGPASYSGSGTSWTVTDAPIGSYTIIYEDVNGYYTPASEAQKLQKDGVITFSRQYIIMERNIIAGAGPGKDNSALVKVFSPDGTSTNVEFIANEYRYGVNVASGDIDGDGIDEIITAPGPSSVNPSVVNIFDSTGIPLSNLSVTAYEYNYGANVASADFDGDGYYEVVTGANSSSEGDSEIPAYVKIFVYDPAGQALIDSGINLLAYDSNHGVKVTAGDIDGDGIPEIITAPGHGSSNSGDVKIWEIDTSLGTGQWSTSFVNEFTVKSKYSINIASGDINGNGYDEIITGEGPHKSATGMIRVFDKDGNVISEFETGISIDGYGANVASGDLDNDGVAEILVGNGPDPENTAFIKVVDAYGIEKTGFHPFYLPYGANVAVGHLGLEGAP